MTTPNDSNRQPQPVNGAGKPKRRYKGRKRGPKSKWGNIDPVKFAVLAGKLGATDTQLAAALGVTTQTLRNWKSSKKQLFCALTAARAQKDNAVEKSLFERALGYKHKAVKILVIDGKVVKVPYTEQYAPDTAAATFWLKNRASDKWRDRTDQTISNPDGTALNPGTTVIAPTVVFVQPSKDDPHQIVDAPATNGANGHKQLGLPEKEKV